MVYVDAAVHVRVVSFGGFEVRELEFFVGRLFFDAQNLVIVHPRVVELILGGSGFVIRILLCARCESKTQTKQFLLLKDTFYWLSSSIATEEHFFGMIV